MNFADETPLVSIILATYNNEETIVPCLSSLVNQDYSPKQIIVINDGSTDRTGEFIKNFQGIELITSKYPSGWASARNRGLSRSNGQVIFFAEGDAIYHTDYVSKAVECMKEDEKIGGVQVMGSPWKIRSTIVTESIEIENNLQYKRISEGKIKPFYSWIFRKSALDSIRGFDETLKQGEDKDIFLRIKQEGFSIGLVPGKHWGHRRNEGIFSFSKKSILRGKTRILFLFKHKKVKETIRNIAPFWTSLFFLIYSFVNPSIFFSVLLLSILVFTILTARSLILYWSCASQKRYLIMLPFFKINRHIMFAIGYTWGIIKYMYGKILGKKIDWYFLAGENKAIEQEIEA